MQVMLQALVGGIYLSIMVFRSALHFLFARSGTILQHRHSRLIEAASSSTNIRYLSWTNSAMVASDDHQESRTRVEVIEYKNEVSQVLLRSPRRASARVRVFFAVKSIVG